MVNNSILIQYSRILLFLYSVQTVKVHEEVQIYCIEKKKNSKFGARVSFFLLENHN